MEDLIVRLKERYTIVVVTHSLAQARRIVDIVAFFWVTDGVGKLVEAGPVDQVFTEPADPLTRAYIEGTHG